MLRLIVLAVVGSITFHLPVCPAEPQSPHHVLKPEQRRVVDQWALKTGLDKLDAAPAPANDLTSWLLRNVPPSAAEEQAQAAAVHARLARTHRIVDLPPRAEKILTTLTEHVPRHQRSESGRCSLTVLDVPQSAMFTAGAGRLFVSQTLLNDFLGTVDRESLTFTFELARLLAHDALGHCRRGYQRAQLEREATPEIKPTIDPTTLAALLRTQRAAAEQLAPFVFTEAQECEADHYAWQLCRNAGIDGDAILDLFRRQVLQSNPELFGVSSKAKADLPEFAKPAPWLLDRPTAAVRLRKLLAEREGLFDDPERFGLYQYDRIAKSFDRAADQAVAADKTPVIFVHGLFGSELSFADLLSAAAAADALKNAPLLAFRYPPNGSLAHAAAALRAEIRRVCRNPTKVRFVAHSAGGLVVRCYAEKLDGGLEKAIMLGTPHQGSTIVRWRCLLDMPAELSTLPVPLPQGMTLGAAPDGPMFHDLQPDSLFLRYLGTSAEHAKRYDVVSGRCLSPLKAIAAVTLAGQIRERLRSVVGKHPSASLREQSGRWLDSLVLPEEVTKGDGCVALRSAAVPGARNTLILPVDHLKLKSDPEGMAWVIKQLVLE